MLTISRNQWLAIVAEAWSVYPLEACGLLLGDSETATVAEFVPIKNAAESAMVYSLDGAQFSKVAMRADRAGLEIVGVVHSHTHTLAYPSATDVAEGTRPLIPDNWHWPIVSLAGGYPELRSFQFVRNSDGTPADEPIAEEPISVLG